MKITWDEETIAEHDKLRGTRMKIDEPDTPYNYEYAGTQEGDLSRHICLCPNSFCLYFLTFKMEIVAKTGMARAENQVVIVVVERA